MLPPPAVFNLFRCLKLCAPRGRVMMVFAVWGRSGGRDRFVQTGNQVGFAADADFCLRLPWLLARAPSQRLLWSRGEPFLSCADFVLGRPVAS